jgi:hypothetical protein
MARNLRPRESHFTVLRGRNGLIEAMGTQAGLYCGQGSCKGESALFTARVGANGRRKLSRITVRPGDLQRGDGTFTTRGVAYGRRNLARFTGRGVATIFLSMILSILRYREMIFSLYDINLRKLLYILLYTIFYRFSDSATLFLLFFQFLFFRRFL